jgi:hypothetical protein
MVNENSSLVLFGELTAVDKVVDLLFAHAGSLGGSHCSFLLLTPIVHVQWILRVAGTGC